MNWNLSVFVNHRENAVCVSERERKREKEYERERERDRQAACVFVLYRD